jgi:hypothetical protein
MSCYPSEITDEYIRANGWNWKDIEMHRSAAKDSTGDIKIERMIWNYETEKGLFD